MVTPSVEHNIVMPINLYEFDPGDKIEIYLDGEVYTGTIYHDDVLSEANIGISLKLKTD